MEETLKTIGLYLSFIIPPVLVKLYDLLRDKRELLNIVKDQQVLHKTAQDNQKEILEQMSLIANDNKVSNIRIENEMVHLEHKYQLLIDNYSQKCSIMSAEIDAIKLQVRDIILQMK